MSKFHNNNSGRGAGAHSSTQQSRQASPRRFRESRGGGKARGRGFPKKYGSYYKENVFNNKKSSTSGFRGRAAFRGGRGRGIGRSFTSRTNNEEFCLKCLSRNKSHTTEQCTSTKYCLNCENESQV